MAKEQDATYLLQQYLHIDLDTEFSCDDSQRFGFQMLGDLILSYSKDLLHRTRKELIEPLGILSSIMDQGEEIEHNNGPDWAKLKKGERARALREYWDKIRKIKHRMKSIAKRYPRKKHPLNLIAVQNTDVISGFCSAFTDKGLKKREFMNDLKEILKTGILNQLPWRQMVSQQIYGGINEFHRLSHIIEDRKKDKAAKFQTLMELAHGGHIEILQKSSFAPILVNPKKDQNHLPPTEFSIKDHTGREYCMDWQILRPDQKDKIVADLQNNRIVLV